jgi:ABC-type sugar transport system permease subunit
VIRLPLATRVLGHPLVALIITVACGYVIYRWTINDTLWLAAMIAFMLIYQTWRAAPQAARHASWMRAWNAMGSGGPGRFSMAARQAIGTAMIIGVGYYLFTQSSNAEYAFALGWMLFVSFAATGVLLWRWLKRRRIA